jgi:hypothetical protein
MRPCFDKILAMVLATIMSLPHLRVRIVGTFRSREALNPENLALRQQVVAFHVKPNWSTELRQPILNVFA